MAIYDPQLVKDNCGFGLIANVEGKPSHKLVRTAIQGLQRMQHRGGISADGKTGDGCGLLMAKPDGFFQMLAEQHGWQLAPCYAVGVCFLPTDPVSAQAARQLINQQLEQEALDVVAWREVPVEADILGELARQTLPQIEQVLINAPAGWSGDDLERRLYMARRRVEKKLDKLACYIASLSAQTVVYKGLCMPADLPLFYPDLADIRLASTACLFHQRFSTNTSPRWELAQPFRLLAHNGEINTIAGNRQWAKARGYKFASPLLPDLQDAAPFVNESGSDSSSLDNMLDLFLAGGMDLFRAFRLLIPPAWQNHPNMDEDLRAFYDFNSMHMEPWDGPAGIVMCNGRYAACGLDRNGLRPARYVRTSEGFITLASEIGIWDYQPDEVLEKGRVGPGELLVIDTQEHTLWSSFEIDQQLKCRHPYREWLHNNCSRLTPADQLSDEQIQDAPMDAAELLVQQKMFGYSREELEQVVRVLGEQGQEATGSMGDDAPMAVLSSRSRSLYDYFRQCFAQVTNPPIDPLRERHVMSLATLIGREQNVFRETTGHANRCGFESPILSPSDFSQLLELNAKHYQHQRLELNYPESRGLEVALEQLCEQALEAVRAGTVLLVLSDRSLQADHLPIPAAMAVGAIQQRLVEQQLRCDSNIIVETGSARDPHHFAVLLGLGATAIYPYLALQSLNAMVADGKIPLGVREVQSNYLKGIGKGLLKIMSKMGISTIASYRCSQLFEAVGLSSKVVERCFTGITSRIEGAGFNDLQADQHNLATRAWIKRRPLEPGGLLKYQHGGEYHAYNPDVVQLLQQASQSGDYATYQRFADAVNQRPISSLRDMLALKSAEQPLPIEQVEDEQQFFRRFDTAAMSIGALGKEAHETLAVAMNRLGGQSNSGEGGEDPSRFNSERNSKIKQIASGRFGVTAHYLRNAEVVQIKMAQGAKPGEGGQLPGHKVSVEIAKLRYSVPGVTLISPPPHHDIYSIEDLAQLIFDIKQINPQVLVSVKLVSEPGVGTIATGVAKAYADLITISGYDGGTGASPLTSVKYAGSPWELGLVETHQALVDNGLRHKVRLQVDGGLKSGLDVVKAAILGAESFGFGTGPMVVMGCKYLRICHLNNCATGVATQDETLRSKYFLGQAEAVMNYFRLLVREVRELMASLGVAELTQLIGRTDLLELLPGITAKQQKLQLGELLVRQDSPHPQFNQQTNAPFDKGELNLQLWQAAEPLLGKAASLSFGIRNTDRSVGALLSGEIAQRYGNQGLAATPLTLKFNGTAGQSFGVWNVGGVEMELTGDANDYVGKGMTGGKLVIKPHLGVAFAAHEASIIGNTCLYGATGGKLFASGKAGERFAVRNSGAIAVVEGIGDNGCEYMTGGIVTVLGQTGINFAAGMTGGFAYVYDQDGQFAQRCNGEMVELLSVTELPIHQEHLRGLINDHLDATGSSRAQELLNDFESQVGHFHLIKPKSAELSSLLGHKRNSAAELRVHAQ
ncbi:glutamate synthase large subunit [Aliagarivorans marinus]|uniref:glutamate synthase large subunit n=1 Tax=Aliagarivorans marinus TaxID=561965 RepID=UPI0003F7543A|nr:glutamate synthase large subunit [Aliagarivorans marinus]